MPSLQQEVPPIPLQSATYRDAWAQEIADYEGIATSAWSSMATLVPGGTSSLAQNTNVLYHHFTVGNQRTDSYDVVMDPIRLTIDAPSVDGGLYNGWFGTRGGISSPFRTPQSLAPVEICPSPLPADSHCVWPEGFMSVQLPNTGTLIGADNFSQFTGLYALAPTVPQMTAAISVRAVKFYVNGVAAGARIDNPQGRQRVNISKGDTFFVDIWYQITKVPQPFAANSSGRACAWVPLSNVSSTRKRYENGSNSGAGIQTLIFYNLDTSPDFNPIEQTYEITISGHSGWTLKDGSNGPHRIETGGGWTRDTPAPGHLRWSRNTSEMISLFFANELPYVRLSSVGPFTVTAAYRPSFGTSTSYRKTTTNLQVLNGNGSTNVSAATVIHVPSGVFNQAGTTTFDLCWPSTGDRRGSLYGYRSGPTPAPLAEVPTQITLTRVPL